MSRVDVDVRVELFGRGCCYESLGFRDVGFSEEELSIQVGEIDRVQIDLRGERETTGRKDEGGRKGGRESRRGQLGRGFLLPFLPSRARRFCEKTYDGDVGEPYEDKVFHCEESEPEEDQQRAQGEEGKEEEVMSSHRVLTRFLQLRQSE